MIEGLRLAVSNIAWNAGEDAEIATLLRAEGCTGVEIAPTKWRERPLEASHADVTAYRAWWEERGLRIIAMQALLFGRTDLQLFGTSRAREEMLDYLRRVIDLGAALGATALVFGSPKNRARGTLPPGDATTIGIPFFRALGEHAAATDVAFCIEPNPPAYGCDFITTLSEAVDLCERVASGGFRVHGDLGALTMNHEPLLETLTAAAPYLGHFHISEPELAEIGTGAADHAAAAEALHEIGYAGWLSIEMRAATHLSAEPLRRAVQLAKAVYGGEREAGSGKRRANR